MWINCCSCCCCLVCVSHCAEVFLLSFSLSLSFFPFVLPLYFIVLCTKYLCIYEVWKLAARRLLAVPDQFFFLFSSLASSSSSLSSSPSSSPYSASSTFFGKQPMWCSVIDRPACPLVLPLTRLSHEAALIFIKHTPRRTPVSSAALRCEFFSNWILYLYLCIVYATRRRFVFLRRLSSLRFVSFALAQINFELQKKKKKLKKHNNSNTKNNNNNFNSTINFTLFKV